MNEKTTEIFCWALGTYAFIIIGSLVAIEVVSQISGVQILTFWEKAFLMSPIYAFSIYQLGYVFYNIKTGKWKRRI